MAFFRGSWREWASLLARLILGGVLLAAGGLKLFALDESVLAVGAYRILPEALVPIVGYALPVIEVIVGLLLIVGLLTRLSALAGLILMVVFIVGIAQAWIRGIPLDCGCFGGGGAVPEIEPGTYAFEIIRDIGLAALACWLIIFPWSKFSLDRIVMGEEFHPDDGAA